MDHFLDAVSDHARATPWKQSIVPADGNSPLTYDALLGSAASFAQFLMRMGCRQGDRIAITSQNTPEFFVALLGTIYARLVAVPVDAGLAPQELQRIMQHASPVAIVVDRLTAPKLAALGLTIQHIAIGDGSLPNVEVFDPDQRADFEPVGPASHELMLLLYTSGTTGTPKGVMHSAATITARVNTITEWFSLTSASRSLCLLPTHFGHGLICNCLSTLYHGGTLILSKPFDLDVIKRVWEYVEKNEVSWFSTVPTIVRLLLQIAEIRGSVRQPSLQFVTCASAPLRVEEIQQFEKYFGVPLLNCYGITETASWTAFSPRVPDREKSSVGVQFGCRIRTADSSGRPLPANEPGELQISGPSVMLGYYKDSALTSQVMKDGWFCSGDYGKVDEQGRAYILGRIKEIIIRAGLNIYPADVDTVLMSHPSIAEAYCVGLEDPILGEKVAAAVVTKSGNVLAEREVIEYCRRSLALYKCPEKVRFVDSIQKNSRGKVNRAQLRPLFAN